MKKIFRYSIAFLVVFPFILFILIVRIFVGKRRAIEISGPYATAISKFFLKLLLPKIEKPDDFDLFRSKTKEKFWLWRPLFDFDVKEENSNIFKLNIWNCPFCELLRKVGMQELNAYVCQGDWEFAKDNERLWSFERNHEIGKGSSFCDHTYKRLNIEKIQ